MVEGFSSAMLFVHEGATPVLTGLVSQVIHTEQILSRR
jgi:hypothetical protein